MVVFPSMNPSNAKQRKRLLTAVRESRRKLLPYRENRLKLIRQYVGKHYSNDGAEIAVPVNLIEMAVGTYLRHLTARDPQVRVGTVYDQLRPQADDLEVAINHLIRHQILLSNTLRTAVRDALFCMGVVKVGLELRGSEEVGGEQHDYGQPFVDAIDLDDWVHDMTAKRWEQVAYYGNRYTVPLWWAKEYELFKPKARAELKPTDRRETNNAGDGDERPHVVGQGSSSLDDTMEDEVELLDLYLPRDNMFVTLAHPYEETDSEPLLVEHFKGPEQGPYHILTFNDVPGNTMPVSPLANLWDLHELANNLFSKIARQATRQKSIIAFKGESEEDAKRAKSASDGEMINVNDPAGLNKMVFGGVEQTTLMAFLQAKQLFTYMGGNLDSLSGQGPQADTLGQEQLLMASASKKVSEMQDATTEFTRRVCRDLAFYLWNEPGIQLPLTKKLAGTGDDVAFMFDTEDLDGDFLDYNMTVEPYSMQHQSPGQKLTALMQIFQQVIAPYAQALEQQGKAVDFTELLDIIAQYADLPEINRILTDTSGSPEKQPVGEHPRQSPVTTRNEVRRSVPGTNTQGQDNVMSRLLMGDKPQASEMVGIG